MLKAPLGVWGKQKKENRNVLLFFVLKYLYMYLIISIKLYD